MIFKNMHEVVKDFKRKMEAIDELVKTLKNKIEHSATYMALLAEGVTKLLDFLKEKKRAKTARKKETAKDGQTEE